MAIEAIIFDMDDLMINSHPMHMEVFEAILNKYGATLYDSKNPLTKKGEASFFGRQIKDVIGYLRKKYHLEKRVSLKKINDEFNKINFAVTKKEVKVMPGLFELIKKLKKQGYKLALASSAKKERLRLF